MLFLKGQRVALLAFDRELAELQAGSRSAFFNAIAVTPEPIWPPAPFEAQALEWAAQNLAHDPAGEGWYGWAILANEGERAPPRLIGIAAVIGRPDEVGDAELALGLLPDFRGRGLAGDTVRTLAAWAFANGARRLIVHLDAEDLIGAQILSKSGFADTGEMEYPGVARWALNAAA